MKNIVKWLIIAVLLVGILAGATTLYNKYSSEFDNSNLIDTETTETTEQDTNETENQVKEEVLDFTVTDYDGNQVNLSDYKGKPIVLNFWATWCYYCKVEMPDFNEAYKKYPDVQFLMVNATGTNGETVESAKAYVEQEQYEFLVLFDTGHEGLMKFGISSFPTTIFIDKDGNIVSNRMGMLTMDALESEIKKIIE